ncbi:4-diphosphocytidyl-2C-methyl-D-erythritol synthase [Haloferax mucosum ATCC BAA-1512]|uniref:4-diphosphocytidyl-2C-methyl-D-erythritol synthase n=1 Tax=Haloferax mucosum ATCC BAA-1512 TaxID=662479 RepID=M0I7X0_9EURY|nr:NTP transferase domain-containing protein [Haloferax mucosum]ELZ91948.1 4-diphosphocytidyl-2C-methyl-D-erythritol synthase [Haloferax mucosum ATCC BAA-1512]
MCGGRGTRLDAPVEKPLVDICGRPMFDRIVETLRRSSVETVHAVTSPYTPRTRARAAELDIDCIDAPGEGYVADLDFALERDSVSKPVVTVVSDLPLLCPDHVDAAIAAADGGSLTACVPVELKASFGASIDDSLVFDYRGTDVCPTGLGVVGADPDPADAPSANTDSTMYLTTDSRLALNVNRPTDIALAEDRCE